MKAGQLFFPTVRRLLESVPGVGGVFDPGDLELDHPRAGDLVALAESDSWFTYYYWNDDALAPDFARTVDIHRKPGYDPCELFMTSKLRAMSSETETSRKTRDTTTV